MEEARLWDALRGYEARSLVVAFEASWMFGMLFQSFGGGFVFV